jgi:hypothetical protein
LHHEHSRNNAASEIEQLRHQVAELRRQLAESERLAEYKSQLSAASWYNAPVDGGSCVEVANLGPVLALRSSANVHSAVLVNRSEWENFLLGVKDGVFDLDFPTTWMINSEVGRLR